MGSIVDFWNNDIPGFEERTGAQIPGPSVLSSGGGGQKTIAFCSDSSQCAVGWRCLGGFCYPPEDTPGSLSDQDEDQGCGSTPSPSADGESTSSSSGSGGSICGGGVSSTPLSCSRPTCGVGGTPEDVRPDGGTGYKDGEPEGGYVTTGQSTDAATYGGGYSTSPSSYSNSCGGGTYRRGGGGGGNPPSPPGGGGGGGGCNPFCDAYSKANGSSAGGCGGNECDKCSTCNEDEGICKSTKKTCDCPKGDKCGKCYTCSDSSCKKSGNCDPPPSPPPPSPPQPPTECESTSVCDFEGGSPSCPKNYKTVGTIEAGDGKCVICEKCEEDCRANGCPDCFDCKPKAEGSDIYACKQKEECGGKCPPERTELMSFFRPDPGSDCAATVFAPVLNCRIGTLNIDCGRASCSATCLNARGCARTVGWLGTIDTWRCRAIGGGSTTATLREGPPTTVCTSTTCNCVFKDGVYKCS